MAETPVEDDYNLIAVIDAQHFELRGPIRDVPLEFEPDTAYVLHTLLKTQCIVTGAMSRDPGFRELSSLVPGVINEEDHLKRCRKVLDHINIIFQTHCSTLIQREEQEPILIAGEWYGSNTYRTNARYTILYEQNH